MLRAVLFATILLPALSACGGASNPTGEASPVAVSAMGSSTTSATAIDPATSTSVPTPTAGITETPVAATDDVAQSLVQGQIAFEREGNIWLFDVTTQQETQLTSDGMSSMPAWSRDGQSLVFVSKRGENADIMRMEADGSVVVALTDSASLKLFPGFDRDGKLYFVRRQLDETPIIEIVRLETDGSEAAVHSEPGGLCGPTGLSVKDETRIALSLNCGRGSYVLLVNTRAKTVADLMQTYGEQGYCANTAVWMAKTDRLAAITSLECSNRQNSNIAVLDMSSQAPKLQTVYTAERIGNVTLSPDEQMVVFERWIEADEPVIELWLLDVRATPLEPRLIVEKGGSPAWRPER